MRLKFFIILASIALFLFACTNQKSLYNELRTGKFYVISKLDRRKIFIDRQDTIQIETDSRSGNIYTTRLKWIDDSTFYYSPIKSKSSTWTSTDSFFSFNPILIKLTEVHK